MEKELTNKRLSERPKRIPVSGRSRLEVRNRDPNYVYRIVNVNLESDPDRVERFKEAGYEIVSRKDVGMVGDSKVDNPSSLGSAGEFSVGRGTKAVVMRIPKEFYEADQAEKQKPLADLEMEAKKRADYGDIQITSTK
jgi:hypothetical protein